MLGITVVNFIHMHVQNEQEIGGSYSANKRLAFIALNYLDLTCRL